ASDQPRFTPETDILVARLVATCQQDADLLGLCSRLLRRDLAASQATLAAVAGWRALAPLRLVCLLCQRLLAEKPPFKINLTELTDHHIKSADYSMLVPDRPIQSLAGTKTPRSSRLQQAVSRSLAKLHRPDDFMTHLPLQAGQDTSELVTEFAVSTVIFRCSHAFHLTCLTREPTLSPNLTATLTWSNSLDKSNEEPASTTKHLTLNSDSQRHFRPACPFCGVPNPQGSETELFIASVNNNRGALDTAIAQDPLD
ncbi:unnamed protein product, partial [Protopolystoma xenopodis]